MARGARNDERTFETEPPTIAGREATASGSDARLPRDGGGEGADMAQKSRGCRCHARAAHVHREVPQIGPHGGTRRPGVATGSRAQNARGRQAEKWVPRQERPRAGVNSRRTRVHTPGGVAPVSAHTSRTPITVKASLKVPGHHWLCHLEGVHTCH